jgi:redox-sensing transcriptional repressor
MTSEPVPDIVVGRLPVYLRALAFMEEEGRKTTSSKDLGERLGISPAQIRKDLSHFGGFGKQGTGYDIRYLQEQLRRILKVERAWKVALVGFGDLGRALAHYGGFRDKGFDIAYIFDNNPQKIGQKVGELEVLDSAGMAEVIRENEVKIAIIAIPPGVAQQVADTLVDAGICAILNYAPITLTLPASVRVQNVDPVVHLQHMTYYLEQ